jgi:hypothetical protein
MYCSLDSLSTSDHLIMFVPQPFSDGNYEGHDLSCATATANCGTMAAMSARRLDLGQVAPRIL